MEEVYIGLSAASIAATVIMIMLVTFFVVIRRAREKVPDPRIQFTRKTLEISPSPIAWHQRGNSLGGVVALADALERLNAPPEISKKTRAVIADAVKTALAQETREGC